MGASVNSRDLKGMTPLYNAICDGNSTLTAEILLKERCELNVVDNTGQWNEIHQVCFDFHRIDFTGIVSIMLGTTRLWSAIGRSIELE